VIVINQGVRPGTGRAIQFKIVWKTFYVTVKKQL